MSPSINKGIGLGYVEVKYSSVGQKLIVDIRGRKIEAVIIKPPFYKDGSIND
jgi:aminomethyltransferase